MSTSPTPWAKLDFYASRKVDELLIIDPRQRSVRWFGLAGRKYRDIERSALIDLGAAQLSERIDWPQTS